MSGESPIWLHSTSVVVIAKFHNPSILNKDFLAKNNITEKEWQAVETISTPAVSTVRYDNGITWTVDQERLGIRKKYDMPFIDEQKDELHKLAASYIQELRHVPYQAIGLNCVLSIENKEPLQWMTQKFLKAEQQYNDMWMMPRFIIKTDKGMLNLVFGEKTMNRGGKETSSIVIDCNLHQGGPFDSLKDIRCALHEWKDVKNIVESKLNEILEST